MLLLTNTKVLRLRKAFANNSLANINYPKFDYIKQDNHEDLGRLLGLLLKAGLPLIGNVLKPLAKSVLIPLGLTLYRMGGGDKKATTKFPP